MRLQEPLADLLARPVPNARAIRVTHRIQRRFRWVFLLEATLAVLFLILLLPLLLVSFLSRDHKLGSSSGDWHDPGGDNRTQTKPPDPKQSGSKVEEPKQKKQRRKPPGVLLVRAYHHHHVLDIEVKGAQDARFEVAPAGQEEGDAVVAALLQAADRLGLVLEEWIEEDLVARWMGGQPFLSAAVADSTDPAPLGLSMEQHGRTWTYTRTIPPDQVVMAWFGLVLDTLLAPLLLFSDAQTFSMKMRQHWADIRGVPGRQLFLELRPDGVRFVDRHGAHVYEDLHIGGAELVGATCSEWLDFGARPLRNGATLRVAGTRDTLRLPYEFCTSTKAFLPIFVDAMRQLRALYPDAVGGQGEVRPTRCPYCGNTWIFVLGEACPTCGGWPDRVEDQPTGDPPCAPGRGRCP